MSAEAQEQKEAEPQDEMYLAAALGAREAGVLCFPRFLLFNFFGCCSCIRSVFDCLLKSLHVFCCVLLLYNPNELGISKTRVVDVTMGLPEKLVRGKRASCIGVSF